MDIKTVSALLVALGAGLSMMLGAGAVFAARNKNEKMLSSALGFAAGVMLCIALSDMLPESRESLEGMMGHTSASVVSGLFFLLGLAFSAVFDKIVPHGHGASLHDGGDEKYGELYRTGIMSALAFALHNLPEGAAIYVAGYQNTVMGISLAIAIAFHNIPAGMIIAMPVYYATGSRKRAFLITLLSGLAQPLGAGLAFVAMRGIDSQAVLGALMSVVAGMMIYISLDELLPASREYGHGHSALWSTLLGVFMILMVHSFGHVGY